MDDDDCYGDDACGEIAGDTLVDAVVLQRDINDRQVPDVLQRPRRRRKLAEYLRDAARHSWNWVTASPGHHRHHHHHHHYHHYKVA